MKCLIQDSGGKCVSFLCKGSSLVVLLGLGAAALVLAFLAAKEITKQYGLPSVAIRNKRLCMCRGTPCQV